MSYISKHASQSLSCPTFMHNFQTIRRIPSFYITNNFFFCSRHSFSTLIPHTSSDWQAIAIAFSYDILCELKHKWKLLAVTTLPNDSPANKDVSFHVKSILKVTVFTLQSLAYIRCLVNCAQVHVHVRKATNLGLYYTQNDHYTTNDAPFLQVETNYD